MSGAYSVLEGAPAIVAAVGRYAVADTSRPPPLETPEVAAALGAGKAPWFDASELRAEGKKLGLGSSAAILVASLAATAIDRRAPTGEPTTDEALRDDVFPVALAAHAAAQGGGSGIDVAAAAWGGIIAALRDARGLNVVSVSLPSGFHIEIWAAGEPASTPELVRKVRALADADRVAYDALLSKLGNGARGALDATTRGSAIRLVEALALQAAGLEELGERAGAPIVPEPLRALGRLARNEGAVMMPSGAGGGDVAIYAGVRPPSTALRGLAIERGLRPLEAQVGARGVHRAGTGFEEQLR